jgi:hypothetical protein
LISHIAFGIHTRARLAINHSSRKLVSGVLLGKTGGLLGFALSHYRLRIM